MVFFFKISFKCFTENSRVLVNFLKLSKIMGIKSAQEFMVSGVLVFEFDEKIVEIGVNIWFVCGRKYHKIHIIKSILHVIKTNNNRAETH